MEEYNIVDKSINKSGGNSLTSVIGKMKDMVGNMLSSNKLTKEDEIAHIFNKLNDKDKIKMARILELKEVSVLIKYLLVKSFVMPSNDAYTLAVSLISKLTNEEKSQLYNETLIIKDKEIIIDQDRNQLTFMFNDIERLCPSSKIKKD